MKTTLETLHTASIQAKSLAERTLKTPVSSILSLCMLVGITATLVGYSQTNTAADEEKLLNHWKQEERSGRHPKLKPAQEIPAYYQHHLRRIAVELNQNPDRIYVVRVHSIHTDTEHPYLLALMSNNWNTAPKLCAVPKEMLTDANWGILLAEKKSDFATVWNYKIPEPPKMMVPLTRTLTSNDGRQITGEVLEKTNTSILFLLESKKITIPINKLSADDQKWLEGTINPRPLMLATTELPDAFLNECLTQGLEVVYIPKYVGYEKFFETEDLKKYDIIWGSTPYSQNAKPHHGVAVKEFVSPKMKRMKQEIDTEKKSVFYASTTQLKDPQSAKKVVEAIIKLHTQQKM